MADDIPPCHDVLSNGTDPIGENPFAPGHPLHERWARATREAEEIAYRIDAEFLSTVATDLDDLNKKIAERIVKIFDVWTMRYINVVLTDPMLPNFDTWVATYAEACLATGVAAFKGSEPSRDWARQYLRHELSGKLGHWKAEARRFLREAQTSIEPQVPQLKASAPATGATDRRAKKVGGPNFAEWFQERIRSSGLAPRRLAELSGSHSKTINRLLDGEQVRIDVVEKLVSALGARITDCPRD